MGIGSNKIIRGNITRPLKPIEDTLKDSELRYRRLFETARDGILIIDADTGCISDSLLLFSPADPSTTVLLGPTPDYSGQKSATNGLACRSGQCIGGI